MPLADREYCFQETINMNGFKLKAILFDADGVCIIPKETFAAQYARDHGFDLKELLAFWDDFQSPMRGEADLKDILKRHRKAWRLTGDIDNHINEWFNAENKPDVELVGLIQELRKSGIKCYLATNQEQYRAAFIKEEMFVNVFDDMFFSFEIGEVKPSKNYFSAVIKKLADQEIELEHVAFFDDRPENIQAAQAVGIPSYLYKNLQDVKSIL